MSTFAAGIATDPADDEQRTAISHGKNGARAEDTRVVRHHREILNRTFLSLYCNFDGKEIVALQYISFSVSRRELPINARKQFSI